MLVDYRIPYYSAARCFLDPVDLVAHEPLGDVEDVRARLVREAGEHPLRDVVDETFVARPATTQRRRRRRRHRHLLFRSKQRGKGIDQGWWRGRWRRLGVRLHRRWRR